MGYGKFYIVSRPAEGAEAELSILRIQNFKEGMAWYRNTEGTAQYLRKTPMTRPWIFTSLAATMIGPISELAGCRRILPADSR
jgi:hypothetical protein